jgi:hypothetical protein
MTSILKVDNLQNTSGTSAMTINSNGIVIPKGVVLQVNAIDTDQAYSASSGKVKIQWETVEIDTISGWDATNHRYTPNVAGYYLVGGSMRASMSNVLSSVAIVVRRNNVANDAHELENRFQSNSDTFYNGSYPIPTGLMQMNGSSDYMEVFFDGEEDVSFHDASDIKSHFFATLVHAT